LTPAALGPNTRQAGQNLSRQALEAQMSGADIPNLPDVSGIGTGSPALTPVPQSSGLDTLLQTIGAVGTGVGGVQEAIDAANKKKAAGQTGAPDASKISLPTGGLFAPTSPTAPTTSQSASLAGAQTDPSMMQLLQLLAQQGRA
jgi:hypothetical protein